MSKKGVAAATGAVIGGSLGAVIGSESGNAGEGLAIGALAGAAAGGLVGYELEKEDQKIAGDYESLSRQEQTIASQQQAINDLRGSASDTHRYRMNNNSNSPSTFQGGSSSRISANAGYQGNPRAIPWNVAKTMPSSYDQYASKSRSTNTFSVHTYKKNLPVKTIRKEAAPKKAYEQKEVSQITKTAPKELASIPKANSPERTAEPSELPKANTDADLEAVVKETLDSELPTTEEVSAAKIDKTSENDLTSAEVTETAEATLMPADTLNEEQNCKKSAEEARHAVESTSNADKLFYYRRALRLCPKDTNYHLEVGRIYSEMGRSEDAQFEFTQALELDANNTAAKAELKKLESEVVSIR